jgi:hypothetical protein
MSGKCRWKRDGRYVSEWKGRAMKNELQETLIRNRARQSADWREECLWGTLVGAVVVVLGMALAYSVWGA